MLTETDCRDEEGKVVGLIDSLISICRVLRPMIDNYEEVSHPIHQALEDLHEDEDLFKILQSCHINKLIKIQI